MRLTTTPHGLRPGYLRPQGRQPRKPEAGGLPAGKWGADQRLGGPSWQAAFMQKPSWPLAAADEGFRAEILESPYTHTETCLVQVSRIVGPLLPGAATDPFRTPVAAPWSTPCLTARGVGAGAGGTSRGMGTLQLGSSGPYARLCHRTSTS